MGRTLGLAARRPLAVAPLALQLACTPPAGGPGADSGDTAGAVFDSADDSAPDSAVDTHTTLDDPLPVCINEWMPSNASSARDELGAYPDWVELHNPGAEAVSLEGWTVTTDRAEAEPAVLGPLVVEPGAFALLWATGGDGEGELPVTLPSAGGELALFAPDGRGTVVTWGQAESDFAVARATDCCTGEGCLGYTYRGTPGASNVASVTTTVPVLSAGSTWRYLDTGADPGESWARPAYDDGAWASGPAPLGYGDEGLATTVGYGADANNKYITTWFRTALTVPAGLEVQAARVGVRRDDGVVVYLDGEEAFRSNMPDGAVTSTTAASSSTGSYNETAYWVYEVNSAALAAGDHVVAIEVHQHAGTSSDLVLDAYVEVDALTD